MIASNKEATQPQKKKIRTLKLFHNIFNNAIKTQNIE
jgi:hypothetical protein